MGLANERRRCIVTSSLIGWTHTQYDPWTGKQCFDDLEKHDKIDELKK